MSLIWQNSNEDDILETQKNMKKIIADTYRELVIKNGVDKVSVAKLVKECKISRTLFYYYFTDVFDVIIYHLEMDLDAAVKDALMEKNADTSLALFLERVMDNRKEITCVLNSKYRDDAEREMLKAASGYMRTLIEDRILRAPVTTEELKFLTKALSYTVFGYIIDNKNAEAVDGRSFSHNLLKFTVGQFAKNV